MITNEMITIIIDRTIGRKSHIIQFLSKSNWHSAHCIAGMFLNFQNIPLPFYVSCPIQFITKLYKRYSAIFCTCVVKNYFSQVLISDQILNIFIFRLQYGVLTAFWIPEIGFKFRWKFCLLNETIYFFFKLYLTYSNMSVCHM